ncbi:hypothetical protein [Halalkalibacter urbisdiaboli]|uniref:hypothetical protein n=1 Tax=Halalkalibacter urbisdiaboli TaxID=1960589 RepID=UPI000B4520DE|nr:hypothetical protein [Halalkalibacter urbisdiaboli]
MNERVTTSVVLYGEIDSFDSKKWLEFYNYIVRFATSINLAPNYMGVSGVSIKSSKISSLKRIEKKLYTSLANNEEISSVSIYNLPADFEIAAFDYNLYISRTNRLKHSHIIVTLSSEIFEKVEYMGLKEDLKNFIDFKEGKIFRLSNLESPSIYASKANDPSRFKTLEVIYEF